MKKIKRALYWLMVFLFLAAAGVQFNDPDPAIWIGMYTSASLVTYWGIVRQPPRTLILFFATLVMVWSGYLATKVIGQQHLFNDEEGREMLGLAIVAAWSFFLAYNIEPIEKHKNKFQ